MERAGAQRQGAGTVNRDKFSAIAHRDHDYCNPIAAAKIERILDLLPLAGRCEACSTWAAVAASWRCASSSASRRMLRPSICHRRCSTRRGSAREWCGALERLQLVEVDIAEYGPEPAAFDLAVMLGGGGILAVLPASAPRSRSGLAPAAMFSSVMDTGSSHRRRSIWRIWRLRREEFRDHRGNVQAGVDAGLIPLHALVASAEEWDEYEWKYSRSIERYAIETTRGR